ncbi:MAG TPA: hypothetical protein VK689_16160 [Armatimonadota bacterium]|nr:hypothetical protein [Armatimonadota bacterium]
MPHSRLSAEEIDLRGAELYEQELRRRVELPENIGKIISIDVESGDYAIAEDLIAAGDCVRARHPDAPMYAARIGYDAVFALGGTLTRTSGE